MSDLCYLSASEALRRFRQRTLSPVELMQAVITRAEAVEPRINAFTYTYFDEALESAGHRDLRLSILSRRTANLQKCRGFLEPIGEHGSDHTSVWVQPPDSACLGGIPGTLCP